MKNILIPTDFSENAWNASQFALAFFGNYEVNYVLAHIEHPDILPPAFEALNSYITGEMSPENQVIETLQNNRKKMLETSSLKTSNIVIDYIETSFIEGIKQLVNKYEIDLIVMGTQGFSASENKIIGTHAQSVITKIQCPVLVIPKNAKFSVPVNIAFPTDYNSIYKSKVLDTLTTICNLHNSSIKIIRIVNPKVTLTQFQHKNRGYLKGYFKDTTSSFHRVNHQNFQEGLQEFIDSMHIDMVAIIAKNLNFFEMLLFKPSVVKMSYHTKIPFLVLHE
ncbi:universal stress protein [Lacinutrix sp. Bg11-31]|uniref:universal stress protein n=1 Tax=Lacinutrix sp. Bg11-31 TaxID=2057808 RepID=UPI000C31A73B|nr:universal stress protein [Lacinutrix sp. Bg11-31]AUC81153.1 universal stress protein [Lacinutrix sp. Bg11-31]